MRLYRVERDLRGLNVSIAPGGITYTCAAGSFAAPWTAVRGVVYTHAPCRLRMPLRGCGADRVTIAAAVHHASGGRVGIGRP